MCMWNEFKEFINKGSVMDLAIGVIIGGAFGKIVSSIVDDLLMPPISKLLAGVDLKALKLVIGSKTGDDGKIAEVAIKYGNFIQTAIEFLIIAFVVFLIVKAYNRLRATAPPPPPAPSEVLLAEIRDLLRK
ncbi:MAG: large-conductance mechanosensitive channel protein MscL [Blastocatellia bacterium]